MYGNQNARFPNFPYFSKRLGGRQSVRWQRWLLGTLVQEQRLCLVRSRALCPASSSRDLGGRAAPRASGRRQAADTECRGENENRQDGSSGQESGQPGEPGRWGARHMPGVHWSLGPRHCPQAPRFTQELTCMQLTLSLARLESDSTASGHTARETNRPLCTLPTAR